MTDEIDIIKLTILEHEKALKMKNLNQELLEHLNGSIRWILSYSKKYGVPLPKKDELLRMAAKADFLVDQITRRADPTKFDRSSSNSKNHLFSLFGATAILQIMTAFTKLYSAIKRVPSRLGLLSLSVNFRLLLDPNDA